MNDNLEGIDRDEKSSDMPKPLDPPDATLERHLQGGEGRYAGAVSNVSPIALAQVLGTNPEAMRNLGPLLHSERGGMAAALAAEDEREERFRQAREKRSLGEMNEAGDFDLLIEGLLGGDYMIATPFSASPEFEAYISELATPVMDDLGVVRTCIKEKRMACVKLPGGEVVAIFLTKDDRLLSMDGMAFDSGLPQ